MYVTFISAVSAGREMNIITLCVGGSSVESSLLLRVFRVQHACVLLPAATHLNSILYAFTSATRIVCCVSSGKLRVVAALPTVGV
jgi:hypothetical protein